MSYLSRTDNLFDDWDSIDVDGRHEPLPAGNYIGDLVSLDPGENSRTGAKYLLATFQILEPDAYLGQRVRQRYYLTPAAKPRTKSELQAMGIDPRKLHPVRVRLRVVLGTSENGRRFNAIERGSFIEYLQPAVRDEFHPQNANHPPHNEANANRPPQNANHPPQNANRQPMRPTYELPQDGGPF